MVRVEFTPNLRRHVDCPTVEVRGETVAQALNAVFAENTHLRGYVLDDHGALRKHMVVFLNGESIRDRRGLTDPVPPNSLILVLQALSGG